jgi:uncharacterized BrkB/YihY/UPF0761 family membrane protein
MERSASEVPWPGYAVQKTFYCVFAAIPYLYLFLTVAGSHLRPAGSE